MKNEKIWEASYIIILFIYGVSFIVSTSFFCVTQKTWVTRILFLKYILWSIKNNTEFCMRNTHNIYKGFWKKYEISNDYFSSLRVTTQPFWNVKQIIDGTVRLFCISFFEVEKWWYLNQHWLLLSFPNYTHLPNIPTFRKMPYLKSGNIFIHVKTTTFQA